MKKLRVIQFGIMHEHAVGKLITLKKMPDVYELVGVVDDRNTTSPTPIDPSYLDRDFADVPRFTVEQALAMNDIDVAFVETPNLELVPMAMKCAEHNLHLHVDKPAGESLEDYRRLLDLCREKGLAFQMGYMFRGNPTLNFVRELVKKNVLGNVYEVLMDMNHGYGGEPYQAYIGAFRGGIMFNLGCHLIDYIVSLFGEPQKVVPLLGTAAGDADAVKNNCMAILEYPHTHVMLQSCSRQDDVTSISRRTLLVNGSNGWAELQPLERFDGKEQVLEVFLKNATPDYPAGRHTFKFPPRQDRYIEQLAELAAIVRGEMANPYTFEHDYIVHKVTLQASGYIE